MRIALAVVLVACARPTGPAPLSATAPEVEEACDLAGWQARATSPLRGRISGQEVIVVGEPRERAEVIARFGSRVLVGTEVSAERFERVVTRETGVARAPGGPWVPGVTAEPSLETTGSGAWLAVHADSPLDVTGFVPREATGRLWQAHDVAYTGQSLPAYSHVLAAPAIGAEEVAAITGGYDIVDRLEPGPPGWLRVEAHTAGVRVTGWTEVSRPSPLHGTYDFSDDTIEGDLVHPDGMGPPPKAEPGCIRARPHDGAHVLGIVTGAIGGRPAGDGWLEVRVSAPWGEVTGYVRGAVSTAAPWL